VIPDRLARRIGEDAAFVHRAPPQLRVHEQWLLGGALDEAPTAYKDVDGVMAAQADLVEAIGEFSPKIVRMDARSKKDRRRRKSKLGNRKGR
jgi:tRNA-splicing ligase RtcB (3'-phosphate/5'-hydroxy nucleic acid ligase)